MSLHFGLPRDVTISLLRSAGIVIGPRATMVTTAKLVAARGVDAVIAQGPGQVAIAGHFRVPPEDAAGARVARPTRRLRSQRAAGARSRTRTGSPWHRHTARGPRSSPPHACALHSRACPTCSSPRVTPTPSRRSRKIEATRSARAGARHPLILNIRMPRYVGTPRRGGWMAIHSIDSGNLHAEHAGKLHILKRVSGRWSRA